jgi:fused signal recognition particle receptor
MFGFLKKKLGDVIKKFTDKAVKEETSVEILEEEKVPAAEIKKEETKIQEKQKTVESKKTPEEVKPAAEKKNEEKHETKKAEKPTVEATLEKAALPEKQVPAETKKEKKTEEKTKAVPEPKKEEPKAAEKPAVAQTTTTETAEDPKKKGFFEKITSAFSGVVTTTKISEDKFESMFFDLEVTLLENNTAVEVIEKIKTDLKSVLVEKPIPRLKVEETIRRTLHKSIEELFITKTDLDKIISEGVAKKKPVRIMFLGINGSGKTTTIAKMAKRLLDKKLKVVIAASDTFRAAAIHQLQEHADKLGVKLIKHDYGSDPAAVAFDAIKYAEAHGIDIVLIDTAGRLHSNINLMDEMKKIVRVSQPDIKIFVGESITGNDCVEQARSFNETVGIDGIILSKADVDEKGGAAISVSYITKKPIYFLGNGQEYDDLMQFKPEVVIEQLGLN